MKKKESSRKIRIFYKSSATIEELTVESFRIYQVENNNLFKQKEDMPVRHILFSCIIYDVYFAISRK